MPTDNSSDTSRIWAVLPVFNNKDTVFEVALKCRRHLENVLVVDDGSTDANIEKLFAATDIKVIKHAKNLGKGQAIHSALQHLLKEDAEFLLTIDADGQHNPDDILRFMPLLKTLPSAIIVGARDFNSQNIPQKSRFGRAFSNFWLRLETGQAIDDSQSGFRAYPVKYLAQIKANCRHYDFEAEVLTRAAWSGLELKQVAIGVFYPAKAVRKSSFRPFLDNLRISLTHARLIGRRLMPLPYPALVKRAHSEYEPALITHPVKLLKALLKESATPLLLAVSAGVGMLFGVLPLLSVHILVVIYVASRLHLNKIMAVAVQNLCMPPFIPALCIELGHFMLYRKWLTDITWKTIFGEIPKRLTEWLLGSLILAPVLAVIVGIAVFFASRAMQQQDRAAPKTAAKKRGNAIGFWFFRVSLKLFGLRGAYGLLYIVAFHYLLFDRPAVNGALAYVKRRFRGSGFGRMRLHVYRLFVSQGKQLIDRYAAISGSLPFDITLKGGEELVEEGFILLTAHMGNWQVALTSLNNLKTRTIHLVMRPEDNPAVERSLHISKEDDFIRVIPSQADLDGVIQIMNALKKGDVVSIMGDRKYNFPALGVSFLGDTAYLPYGAFAIAAGAKCPVVVLLSAKLAHRKYIVDVSNVFYPRYNGADSKSEQLRGFVQQFAATLETYTQQYPYQCFLFHDVWANDGGN